MVFPIISNCCCFSLFICSFAVAFPKLDDDKAWIQTASSITIALLAALIIAAVWSEIENQVYYRFMTVVAIFVGLETLVIPILMKLRSTNGVEDETLTLKKIEEQLYEDSSGERYEVRLKE